MPLCIRIHGNCVSLCIRVDVNNVPGMHVYFARCHPYSLLCGCCGCCSSACYIMGSERAKQLSQLAMRASLDSSQGSIASLGLKRPNIETGIPGRENRRKENPILPLATQPYPAPGGSDEDTTEGLMRAAIDGPRVIMPPYTQQLACMNPPLVEVRTPPDGNCLPYAFGHAIGMLSKADMTPGVTYDAVKLKATSDTLRTLMKV